MPKIGQKSIKIMLNKTNNTNPEQVKKEDLLDLPKFPEISPRFLKKIVTKHVLKVRMRELCGQGFGWKYYTPRVGGMIMLVLLVTSSVAVLVGISAESINPATPVYAVRRWYEDIHLMPSSQSEVVRDSFWKASRRLAEVRQVDGLEQRRSLLREFEATLNHLESQALVLDPLEQTIALSRARSLEDEAIAIFSSWQKDNPISIAANTEDKNTWVVEADRAITEHMVGPYVVPFGVDPDLTSQKENLEDLLADTYDQYPELDPVLRRLRALIRDGSPYSSDSEIDAYARFLAGSFN